MRYEVYVKPTPYGYLKIVHITRRKWVAKLVGYLYHIGGWFVHIQEEEDWNR